MECAAAVQSDCEALHAEVGDASPCRGGEDSERHAVGDVSAAMQAAVDAHSRGEKRQNMLELERAMCAVLLRAACRLWCVCCSVKSRRLRTATHKRRRGLAVERACVRAARKVGSTQRAGAPVWCGMRECSDCGMRWWRRWVSQRRIRHSSEGKCSVGGGCRVAERTGSTQGARHPQLVWPAVTRSTWHHTARLRRLFCLTQLPH